MEKNRIKIEKLNKYFNKGKSNEVHVINDTSLEFDNTGLVCILGESGSGKTTLLNTIGGLDTFQNGNITIGESTLKKYSSKEMEKLRNSKFGYIFQEKYLLQDYTVAYNIRLALNRYDSSEEEKEARVDYVLEAVDMKKYKKRLVSQLSGGQQQRIAIARALVKSPDIIFADEPTGSLDEANTMRTMSIIKKISKNCLVILVTHEKRIAEFFADRIIYLQDGKVIKDITHKGNDTYKFSEDNNLYLKEYEKITHENGEVKVNLYHNGQKSKITLNVISRGDKFYIQTPKEEEVVYLTQGSEMKMIDDVKPVIDMEQIENYDYSLSRLESSKNSNLSWKEIYRLAKSNVKMLGKKQLFMMVSFIITSIMLVIAAADYMTATSVDKKNIVTADSHYISVSAKRSNLVQDSEFANSFSKIYDKLEKSNLAEDVYIDLSSRLSFTYGKIVQIRKLQYTLSGFSYVTLDHLKQEDLIYGRMPKEKNEIVIDKWLVDQFYESDSILKKVVPDIKFFLGIEAQSDSMESNLKVVGISDVGEPAVYIDKYMGIGILSRDDKVSSLTQLQAEYPGKYDDVKLAEDEVLVSESLYNSTSDWMSKVYLDEDNKYKFVAPNGIRYTVVGSCPDEFNVSYIINDIYYKDFLSSFIKKYKCLKIYTDDSRSADILKSLYNKDFSDNNVTLKAKDTYKEQMADYEKERAYDMNARFVVTLTVFFVSMFMLFFTMKSNVIKRVQEISVYRLMGITKSSIIASFLLEIIIVTSYTALPVIIILSGLIKLITGIESLQLNIVYPWTVMAGLLVFVYVVNIIVSLIPVYGVIKLPPAQMADKS